MRKSPAALEHKGENTQGVWNAAGSCYSNNDCGLVVVWFYWAHPARISGQRNQVAQGMGVNCIHLNMRGAQIFQGREPRHGSTFILPFQHGHSEGCSAS